MKDNINENLQISNGINKNTSYKAPPQRNLPIIQKLISAYKLWQEFLPHLPKTSRYSLGSKIDLLFLEVIETIFLASYSSKTERVIYLQKASLKLDSLKFFLQISWEIKSIDNNKYIKLSEHFNEIGKMLGGWMKQL